MVRGCVAEVWTLVVFHVVFVVALGMGAATHVAFKLFLFGLLGWFTAALVGWATHTGEVHSKDLVESGLRCW